MNAVLFARDGKRIVSASNDNTVRVWAAGGGGDSEGGREVEGEREGGGGGGSGGECLQLLTGHTADVVSLCQSGECSV